MEGSGTSDSGFPAHLQQQLNQAARKASSPQFGRGRGQHAQGRDNFNHTYRTQHQQHNSNYSGNSQYYSQPNSQSWSQAPMTNPTDLNSFPPLGSPRMQASVHTQQAPVYTQQPPVNVHRPVQGQYQHPQDHGSPMMQPQGPRRGYQQRGRGGNFRGRGNQGFHGGASQNFPSQHHVQSADDFHRPAPAQRKLFTHGSHPHFNSMEEQRAFQRTIMDQSDFLNYLANQSLKNQLTAEEQQAKESFRKELEATVQKVIMEARTDDMKFNPEHVQLKLYGSLGSGFAVSGSDMDLLLAFPQDEGPLGDIEIDCRRLFEKALLDQGIGARLLTNTRVPILRVCQKPSPELLHNLRQYRAKWEESSDEPELPVVDQGFGLPPALTEPQLAAAITALADLDLDAHQVPLPASPVSDQTKLEFVGDCGIQCDINFSNYVALHNTRLLKTYGMCDPRVRQVGVFVKNWAKSRDINTPYRGTLSSYGYVLMVLHYLMNVVTPPILPNLQEFAKQKDTWAGKTEIELVEGFDVRFIRDMNEVKAILKDMPRNHESVGALLRGFFWYYADPRGYHWNQDVVSIRIPGGRMPKRTKGWTEAKRASGNPQIRLRYLLAIEDPFELEHNVGRTVGHNGLVAIRDEFRRAWAIIEKIKFDTAARTWYWLTADQQTILGHEMIAAVENRGDLHRKDQDFHKNKMRQLRLALEAKEKALQDAADQEVENVGEGEMNGTFEVKPDDFVQNSEPSFTSTLKLINNGESQVTKYQTKQSRRRVVSESDEEVEVEKFEPEVTWQDEPKVNSIEIDWDKPFSGTEIKINDEWDTPEWGNPVAENMNWNTNVEETKPVEIFEHGPGDLDPSDAVVEMAQDSIPTSNSDNHVTIGWDRYSHAGRWLLWRDKQIQKGTWSGSQNPELKHLDETFPYDPSMTVAELASKNKLLKSKYKNKHRTKLHPNEPPDKEETLSQNSVQPSTIHTTTSNQDSIKSKPPVVKQRKPPKSRKLKQHPAEDNNIPPDPVSTQEVTHRYIAQLDDPPIAQPDRVSPQHVNRFITRADPPKHSPPAEQPDKTQKTDGPNYSSSITAVYSSTTLSQPSQMVHNQKAPTSTTTTTNSESLKLLKLLTIPSSSTSQQPAPQPQPPKQHPSLVPLTLYPHLPPHRRPRDEDPNIMPIPRSLDFQFDLRQLADLDIIRRGGNGCAREGEEFEIEENYEFGGLGNMVDADTSPRADGDHGDSKDKQQRVWDAKGDDAGLLHELPHGGWGGASSMTKTKTEVSLGSG